MRDDVPAKIETSRKRKLFWIIYDLFSQQVCCISNILLVIFSFTPTISQNYCNLCLQRTVEERRNIYYYSLLLRGRHPEVRLIRNPYVIRGPPKGKASQYHLICLILLLNLRKIKKNLHKEFNAVLKSHKNCNLFRNTPVPPMYNIVANDDTVQI